MSVTIIVPTFNEAPNILELVRRIEQHVGDSNASILFVDDSVDDTPDLIEQAAKSSAIPIELIHRKKAIGGLSGAVVEGLNHATTEWCVVMDGDLQHPPEMIPVLLETGESTGADVVVASRHVEGGSNGGLNGLGRKIVSTSSTIATKAMFPISLRNCTDPMTGFFALRRSSVDVSTLKPRGFKILLEILTRGKLKVAEEPFIFGERFAGESKANFTQGIRFLVQLASLRFGRLSAFAVIGAIGAVANLAIMAALVSSGINYIVAAIVAAAVTIIANFFLQEHFVFRDLTREGKPFAMRFAQSVGFNGAEAAVRLPILFVIVDLWLVPSVLAQAVTLLAAFVFRFIYHSRIVYRPRRTAPSSPLISGAKPVDVALDKSTVEGL
jgi:dolichol-phosphate mannosyltransferase